MSRDRRGVSPVISVILMAAVVVVLAATISVFVLGFGEQIQDPSPSVAQSSGEFVEQNGTSGAIVRIQHLAGDPVSVDNLEIAVDATDACGKRARIVNLPGPEPPRTATTPTYFPFDDNNFVRGAESFISEGTVEQQWNAGVLHKETSSRFDAGSFFEFRIISTKCAVTQGEQITVRVIHLPSDATIIKQELTA